MDLSDVRIIKGKRKENIVMLDNRLGEIYNELLCLNEKLNYLGYHLTNNSDESIKQFYCLQIEGISLKMYGLAKEYDEKSKELEFLRKGSELKLYAEPGNGE